jgi:hypothetical protein
MKGKIYLTVATRHYQRPNYHLGFRSRPESSFRRIGTHLSYERESARGKTGLVYELIEVRDHRLPLIDDDLSDDVPGHPRDAAQFVN